MTTIERLPVRSRPGWDCRFDHANCPHCKAHGENDHGIDGGSAWYAVRGQVDGRRVVLVLEVLRHDFPETANISDKPWLDREPTGAALSLHYDDGTEHDCDWFGPGSKCRSEVLSYLAADEFYKTWGNPDTHAPAEEQHEGFWLAFEARLRGELESEPVLS